MESTEDRSTYAAGVVASRVRSREHFNGNSNEVLIYNLANICRFSPHRYGVLGDFSRREWCWLGAVPQKQKKPPLDEVENFKFYGAAARSIVKFMNRYGLFFMICRGSLSLLVEQTPIGHTRVCYLDGVESCNIKIHLGDRNN